VGTFQARRRERRLLLERHHELNAAHHVERPLLIARLHNVAFSLRAEPLERGNQLVRHSSLIYCSHCRPHVFAVRQSRYQNLLLQRSELTSSFNITISLVAILHAREEAHPGVSGM